MLTFQTMNSKRRRDDDSDSDGERYIKVRVYPLVFSFTNIKQLTCISEISNMERTAVRLVRIPFDVYPTSAGLSLTAACGARSRGHDARPLRAQRCQLARFLS
jgi:hypothetical protein